MLSRGRPQVRRTGRPRPTAFGQSCGFRENAYTRRETLYFSVAAIDAHRSAMFSTDRQGPAAGRPKTSSVQWISRQDDSQPADVAMEALQSISRPAT